MGIPKPVAHVLSVGAAMAFLVETVEHTGLEHLVGHMATPAPDWLVAASLAVIILGFAWHKIHQFSEFFWQCVCISVGFTILWQIPSPWSWGLLFVWLGVWLLIAIGSEDSLPSVKPLGPASSSAKS
jgi:hypothetical protein